MADTGFPKEWIGSTQVVVGLMEATIPPSTAKATVHVGTLQEVTGTGILATLRRADRPDEVPVPGFYPWGAVLSIVPGRKRESEVA